MAKFSIPNLCGANPKFNDVATKMDDLKKKLQSNVTAKASELSVTMKSELVTLDINISLLMTKKPTLSNISLQLEIKDLATLTVGSAGYNSKVATITAKFGPALAKKNLDVIKLAAAAVLLIAGKKDVCDLVPNLELPAAGGDVIEKAKNVTQPGEDSDEELPSTIVNPVLALDSANEKITLRLTEAAKQFAAIVPKLTVGAGSTGRVGSDVRQAFREADVRISSAMSAAGFSASPTDSRLADIKGSDASLDGGEGTAKPWINPNVEEEKFERELETSDLDTVASNFRDLLQKATKSYPENLDDTGTKVFFPPSNMATLKESYAKSVKIKTSYVESLTNSAAETKFSTTSTSVKLSKEDMTKVEKKLSSLLSDFKKTSVRLVTDTDKIVEPDLFKTTKKIPKYDDYEFDL